MVCKWIKVTEFNFNQEIEFDCYIFLDNKVVKAKYSNKIFNFNYGFCGVKFASHVMKISIPKEPKLSFENES